MMKPGMRRNHPWRKFTWKLTLSYTLITIATFLVVMLSLAVFSLWVINTIFNSSLGYEYQFHQLAVNAALYVPNHQFDRQGMQGLLQSFQSSTSLSNHGFLVVVDQQGRVEVSQGDEPVRIGETLATYLPASANALLQATLTGGKVTNTSVKMNEGFVDVEPIRAKDASIVGALVWKADHPQMAGLKNFGLATFFDVLVIAIIFSVIFGIVSTIFGFFTARGFTSRFSKLSEVINQWSQGNFTAAIKDTNVDEISYMSLQLNGMVGQLQQFFQAQQQLAMLEERNRLARELHDSVKQQVFALSLQISTAKELVDINANAAKKRLELIEQQVQQTQQELTTMIHAMRPAVLESKGLAQALQEYAKDWAQQRSIQLAIQIETIQGIPPLIEDTYYRIAQEALSNVARHSEATHAQVSLRCVQKQLVMTIVDNGKGFAVDAKRGKSVGLLSMQERIEAVNGHMNIESSPGNGTTIQTVCLLDTRDEEKEKA
ncbi:MAG: hypothetical protein JO011_20330 [Ktedonobacteraceae bacterium]|nr:hypothetical protein [Ktedonobacteraceae bacterium]